ncbi:MAG: hypothetical protein Q8L86_01495 [Vicinamibacterales bacterium]|nr:hypothetical protein [Vicinamibacterales bacterium]
MSEVAKWSVSPALGLAVLVLLALVNLAGPVEAQSLLAVAQAPLCDFETVRGGVNWGVAIDAGCAISAVGALVFPASTVGLAACALWGLGRLIYQNM